MLREGKAIAVLGTSCWARALGNFQDTLGDYIYRLVWKLESMAFQSDAWSDLLGTMSANSREGVEIRVGLKLKTNP